MPKLQLDTKHRKAFERLPKETDKAFQAFIMYREMGFTRTIAKVAEDYRKIHPNPKGGTLATTNRILQGWSGKYAWVQRANAWDAHLDDHRRALAIKEVEEMRGRQASYGKSLQAVGGAALTKLARAMSANTGTNISAADIVRLIQEGAKLERVSRDMPETITEERVENSTTTEESREKLRPLLSDPEAMKHISAVLKKVEE